jgi:hypothetical protein
MPPFRNERGHCSFWSQHFRATLVSASEAFSHKKTQQVDHLLRFYYGVISCSD